MQKLKIKDFNLSMTLESGQFFRYKKFADFYFVNAGAKVFSLKQHNNNLYYDGVSEDFVKHFFTFDKNYPKIIKSINKDKILKSLTKKHHGLRLIRQDPWECMMSYVCSSNSSIPNIQNNIELLSKRFGKPVNIAGYVSHSFPELGKINHLESIKACKTGYRANYLYELNKSMNSRKIQDLQYMNYQDAHNILTQLPGIGPKVADCVSLFSLGHTEAFPVDTWIKRIMEEHYFDNNPTPNKNIKQFAQDYWGKYAGYAELFLFMLRNN